MTDIEEFLAWAVVVFPTVYWCWYWLVWPERNCELFESMRPSSKHPGKIGLGILVIFIWSMVWGFDWNI